MSLITCCPACGTMFKVVPDQLRISEGWVRCGHCSNVFDAAAHMADPPQGPPLPVLREEIAAPPPAARDALGEDAQDAWEPTSDELRGARREADAVPPAFHAPPEPVSPPVVEPAAARSDFAAAEPFARRDEAPDAARSGMPAAPIAGRAPVDDAPSSLPYSEAPEADVSFVREGRRRAFWRRPLVRAGLALVALVLLGVLAAQVAVQERDRLAAAEPALRPWLEQLCAPLRCRVGPPRQIEAIVIDSSTFSKARGDTYRLSVTLKNSSPAAVAVPSLELTLTDTQDQPVLRRVLSPAELGAPAPVLPGGGDWSATVGLAVANGGSGRIAGYRLLAFYP